MQSDQTLVGTLLVGGLGCWDLLQPKPQLAEQSASLSQLCDQTTPIFGHDSLFANSTVPLRRRTATLLPTATVPFSHHQLKTSTLMQHNAKWRRCINSTAATVDKILPVGFVLLQGVLMATKAGSPPSQFTDL